MQHNITNKGLKNTYYKNMNTQSVCRGYEI